MITLQLPFKLSYAYSSTSGVWTTATLSESRGFLAATSIGNELLLFGGGKNVNSSSDRVDIYHVSSNEWSTATLSLARYALQATSVNGLALFAGGMNSSGNCFDTVDIYNRSSNTWSVSTLSQARTYLSSASNGEYAFFAGGSCGSTDLYDTVDIYNSSSQQWITTSLSASRVGLMAVSVSDIVLFAGGAKIMFLILTDPTSLVDVFNVSSFKWMTTTSLSESQAFLTGTALGELAIFAGGWDNDLTDRTNRVDIYNSSNGDWSTATLSIARSDFTASTLFDVALFAGGWNYLTTPTSFYDNVDIYNSSSNTWSNEVLSQSRAYLASVTGTNFIMFAGGETENNGATTNIIDIYTIPSSSSSSSSSSTLSHGDVAAIVILLLLLLLCIGLVIAYFYYRKRRRNESNAIALENRLALASAGGFIPSTDYNSLPSSKKSTTSLSFDNNDASRIRWSNLRIIKQIGKGAFGCVFLGEFNRTEVAVKRLTKEDITKEDIEEFIKEANLMKSLSAHPNVVMFRGITLPPDPISIITDFCNGGSLFNLLHGGTKIAISTKIRLIRDIAKGMLHLHKGIPGKQVIHRDLATRNILLKNGIAMITDFGMSRVKETTDDVKQTNQTIGPVKWMSPEAIFERKYSTKSDVFSFGVVLYEIITQKEPWNGFDAFQVSKMVSEGRRMSIPGDCECPPSIKSLMESCWAQSPSQRPEFEKICDYLSNLNDKEF